MTAEIISRLKLHEKILLDVNLLQLWKRKWHIVHKHGGNTKIPTCAVNRVCNAQHGCLLRIMAFDRAVTVGDTSDFGLRPRLYHCRWTWSKAGFCIVWYMIGLVESTYRTNGITPVTMMGT